MVWERKTINNNFLEKIQNFGNYKDHEEKSKIISPIPTIENKKIKKEKYILFGNKVKRKKKFTQKVLCLIKYARHIIIG